MPPARALQDEPNCKTARQLLVYCRQSQIAIRAPAARTLRCVAEASDDGKANRMLHYVRD